MSVSGRLVLDHFKQGGIGAEIGVYKGRLTTQILKQVKPKQLYLVDPWMNFDDPGLSNARYADGAKDMSEVFELVQTRFADQIAGGQVEILRGTTAEVEGSLPDDGLDFIYIDGDHRYEGVSVDLEVAGRKIATGGIIAVDDYVTGAWWGDGVIRAAHEFLGAQSSRFRVEQCDRGQLVLRNIGEAA